MIREVCVRKTRQNSKTETTLYATGSDFCWIFREDMQNLYALSLLLTADEEKAEQCFVSGLDDCAEGNQVFKEWARSWARRAIIKRAIRLIAPEPGSGTGVLQTALSNAPRVPALPQMHTEISSLFGLQPFERFVLVLSVLERYSDRECELLLGCSHQALITARVRALQQIARVGDETQVGARQRTDVSQNNQDSLIALSLRTLATPA
jgi:hypothetical protein